MLVGGDLGFPYLVLVVVVVLFVPVIGFVVRRKWRHAAARREEIKRLLVLASEEAARAELEATVGYSVSTATSAAAASSVSLKPQYQCAVCFCPTTTRCSKCKAVRYCSGKCQIIHWRQGHKDECRPFVNTHHSDEVGGSSGPKILEQDDNDNYVDNYETEGVQRAKPVDRYAENPAFSRSNHLESLHQKDDAGTDYLSNGKATDSTVKSTVRSPYEGSSASSICSDSSVDASASISSESDSSGGFLCADVPPDDFETKTFSDSPSLVNPVDSFIGSVKANLTRPYIRDGHGQSGKLGSPGRNLDDSNKPELSTASAGFWEGTIHSKWSRTNMLDDAGRSSSGKIADENITNSQSSLSFSFDQARRAIPSLNVQGSNVNPIKSHVAVPTTFFRKPVDEQTTFSEESFEDGMKRKSASTIPEMLRHADVNSGSDSRKSISKDVKSAPSGIASSRPVSSVGGHLTNEDAKTLGSLRSSCPDRSNHELNNNKCSTLHTSKPLEVGSVLPKASDTHSTSCTTRRMAQSSKSVKVDEGIREVPACSLQLAENSQGCRNGLKTSMLKVVDQLKTSKLSRHYPLGAGSEMAGGHGSKGVFPYELFVKLFNSKKVELLPCGLINCGNSCYANAVLQCLAFTPPLTAYLLQGLHSKSCEKKEWCFTCEFESLVRKAKDGNSPLSPIRILSQIQNIGSHLGNGREEDAHEFLRYAIDTMQSVCLREAETNVSGSAEEETTLVGLTFGGYLRSKIKCMKCGGKSERHETMMDLTVEIEGDIRTLEEALNKFTGTEILDGDNKYQCCRCKSYEKAKKKLSVLEAPNILTIALKRFQSGKFGKLNKAIQFPEILDLAPYVSGTSDKSPVYRLYGVVVHVDIMNAAFSGHYVCYVKNVQNKWFKIDDSKVKEVELNNVLTKGAYMLLYARFSPRAPRSIRNSLIPRDPRKHKNTISRSRSHSIESWDFSRTDHLNDHLSSQPFHRISDEDSLSDHSSSIFSESCSCSTESSNRDSSSTEEYFDHIFGDLDRDWNSGPWRNSSDSDTSSSSSSPSPLYSRHSPLADSNRYASGHHETNCSQVDHAESGMDGHGHGHWSRIRSRSSKEVGRLESSCFLGSDHRTKDCRNLDSSSSCRETNADRLGGWVNPVENVKCGVSFRRSTRGRAD